MRSHAPLVVSIFAGLFALLVDGSARANIQSPPEEACSGKKVDDPCQLPSGEAGACKADKCNQLDYSQGSPPKAVEVDCVVCIAGAAPPGPGPVAVGEAKEAPPEVDSAPVAATTNEPAAAPETSPEPPSSDARCSVSRESNPAWMLVVLVGGLAARRRR